MWIPASNKYGVAIHNWHGKVPHGLELDVGDSVEILEENGPWLRGTCPRRPRTVGLFPRTYIHVKDSAKADPIVTECTQVLREWSETWKKLFVERDTYKYTYLRKVMLSLLESRRELLGATLTQDQTLELQMKVISKIDWGNRKLGIDLVPRIGPLEVDPHETGIVSLHNVHVKSADNASASSSHGTLRKKSTKKAFTHHLYFCMRDFGHRIGDDAEIYFHLYDAHPQRCRPLSERFVVRISKDGFANYIEKLHSNCTIFTDLGTGEINSDLYLVAHIMRVGKITASDSVRKDKAGTAGAQSYRRPYGVGILPLADIALAENAGTEAEEREFCFKCFQCDEKDFHTLHAELIAKKSSGKFTPIQPGGGAGGGLGAVNGGGSSTVGIVVSLKLLHGGLSQARLEQPMLFQSASVTRKTGFPDIIMPGDVRNDVFFTLERGEFERGGKSTAKNIEVTCTVLDAAGNIIPDCLWGASGMEPCFYYKSMILYHNNAPSWNEMIRLSVSIDVFSAAHIRFDFRHCSTRDKSEPKLFAFAFARLMEPSGATLADRQHELYVYKCEDAGKLVAANYLRMRCSAVDDQAAADSGQQLYGRSAKECFYVKSLLCSTKLTQNGDLLSLLQWRTHPERIQDSLQRVLNLRDEELVKFLQDVLDALFAMFSNEEGNSTEHSGLVFHVLVSIFYLLQSTRFQHFKPVMEAYIEDHFAAALVYKGLIFSVRHLAEWMSTTERREPIQKCFGSLEYIFKLIIQSRKLFARATSGQYEDSFRKDLYSLFAAFNGMLATVGGPADEECVPTQEALLHSVGVVLVQLEGTLSANELGALAKNMLDAVPRDTQPRLNKAKLQAVKDLVSGQLFANEECRSNILALACRHVRIHLARRDELRLCADILAEIVRQLWELKRAQAEKMSNTLQHDLNALCRSVLDILMQTIMIIIEGSPAVLGGLVAVLLGILQLLDESNYVHLWDELCAAKGELGDLRDFLHQSMLVFKELLAQDWQVFPPDWLVMRLTTNDVIRRALEEFAKPLVYRFLSPATFDSHLWWSYFSLAVAFLTQPCLQLEKYHETKRRKILNTHGDGRVLMGFQILSMWSQLAEHKLQFIPSMVGPFLEVTLVPEPALRKATLTVFYDMMQCEQAARGSFRLVESELIDKLDLLISENKGDDEYRELFSTILYERVNVEEPAWRAAGSAFISSVTRLLERLLDYRSVMQGEENRDKRMSCTVNLLNFYKNEINRKEMYLRYIYKLHGLHLQSENYAEAGFTLKLYADMLSWDRESLTFSPMDAAGQPEWLRKERLYHEILGYFDKGKCWEKGIPLCKELADFYETKRFDYARLSEILQLQARFFQNILSQIRPEPEYFRVGFYGTGFPLFVRNKQFVYRGLEYERIGAFTQRLQTEFGQAQILTRNSAPDAATLVEPGQWIQISTVRPLADVPAMLREASVPVPERIERFYQVNDVRRFQHDRPVYKGQVDRENEFKSLWIERTTMDVASTLPGILRWFEVTSRSTLELHPVEFACETMSNVERELHDLITQFRAEPTKNINPFSMRLQGIIDANVMGGISKYQEAFFTDEFARSAEGRGQQANVHRLRCLIMDQVCVLDTALELHGQLAPAGVQPLHKRLLERFAQLRESLGAATAAAKLAAGRRPNSDSIVNTPLPPLPTEAPAAVRSNGGGGGLPDELDDGEQLPQPTREALQPLELNRKAGNEQQQQQVIYAAPPIPSRPRSACYSVVNNLAANGGGGQGGAAANYSNPSDYAASAAATITNSPEIPPKGAKAPPLPPRGYTPDKRASNPMPFGSSSSDRDSLDSGAADAPHLPQRQRLPGLKYSVVNISLDDCEGGGGGGDGGGTGGFSGTDDCAEADHQFHGVGGELAGMNNLNNHHQQHQMMAVSPQQYPAHPVQRTLSNGGGASGGHYGAMNIPMQESGAPPIPPKSVAAMAALSFSTSLEEGGMGGGGGGGDVLLAAGMSRQHADPDDEDGYCVPKELAAGQLQQQQQN